MGTSFLRAYVYMACARLFFREEGRTNNYSGDFTQPVFSWIFSRARFFWRQNFSGREKFRLAAQMFNGGDHMISKSKMSKKAQRELNAKKRVTWDFSPVSRVKQSKKVYNRKRLRDPE